MNNLLSIDYGERYMGFAVRTNKTQIPIPIEVVDIKKNNIGDKIAIYVDSYDINKFIIGYPLGMNLSENRMTKNVDNFIKEELMKYNLPISKIDERFTSELIKNTKNDRVDDLSALEILETYIKNND
ncbi:RuvX/YqgF family protein [Acidimicrobiaceae bacterium]|nr:RuvX/YqgF family protein [Acidimicrobiaceae bacterium]